MIENLNLKSVDPFLADYFSKEVSPSNCVLQFSGGKDSLACLYLLEDHWNKLTVLWCNTGAAFPETVDQMNKIREMVPHFVEVKGRQPEQIEQMGLPSDIVPVRNSVVGYLLHPGGGPLLQEYWSCCGGSFWIPMHRASLDLGATMIIRGQRRSESRRSPIPNGYVDNGLRYCFPLENWSEQQVFDFLKYKSVEIPAHYQYTKTSLDCWSCTAYLDQNKGLFHFMRENHPELWSELEPRLRLVRDAISSEFSHLEEVLS